MPLLYCGKNIPLVKALRKDMTPWERRLWYDFLKTAPARFQRQKPIGPYIADFYCHSAKLVLELDGGQHYEPEHTEKDRARDAYLTAQGLCVLRFSNLEIDRQFSAVCEEILRVLSLPLEGGGRAQP